MSLAENLQYLRAREGVTQEQLAERLDVSRQSVSKWESAASYPEMDTLLKLCDMFQVDMDTLLRGSVENSLSEDTAGYDRFMTLYARKIAGGVGAILLGVVMMVLAFTVLPEREPYESYIGAAFLAVVACAVYFLIYGGMLEDKYNIAKYNRQNNPTPEDKSRRRRATTACSVIMILATAVFLFAGLAYYKWNWAAIIYPVGGVLCGAAWMLLGPRMEE